MKSVTSKLIVTKIYGGVTVKMKKRYKKILTFLLVVMMVMQNSFSLNASEPAAEQTTAAAEETTTQKEKEETAKEEKAAEKEKEDSSKSTETKKEDAEESKKESKEEAKEDAEAEDKTAVQEETSEEATTQEAVPEESSETSVKEQTTETAPETATEAAAESTQEETTEEKSEPKTEFSYEDSRVKITATAKKEANLPETAQLKARYIKEGSDEYKEAVNIIKKQNESDEKQFLDFVCYDVFFEVDGKEVEPEAGTVKVTMKYKTPIFKDVADEATEFATYHITDSNKVEDVTEKVNTNGDGAVTSVKFSTESFSKFISAAIISPTSESEDKINYNDFGLGFTTEPSGEEWKLGNANWSTTKFIAEVTYIDDEGKKQKKTQTAFCLESLFRTPTYGGSDQNATSEELEEFLANGENSEQIKKLQKILYYGSPDSPGYVGAAFLEEKKEDIIRLLGKSAYEAACKNPYDFFFILTHVASSYQYFSTKVQPHPNVSSLNAEDCAFWGVNQNGREVIHEWSDYLIGQTERGLKLLRNNVETTTGFVTVNSKDEYRLEGKPVDSKITIDLPQEIQCVVKKDGKAVKYDPGSQVEIYPGSTFYFSVVSSASTTRNSLKVQYSGEFKGDLSESASIAIINHKNGSETFQDIGLLTLIDTTHNKQMTLNLQWTKGAFELEKTGKDGEKLSGVEFDVFSDSSCKNKIAGIKTDSEGQAYLEVAITEAIAANDNKIYLKETKAARGYVLDENVKEVTLIPIKEETVSADDVSKVSVSNELLSVKVNKTDLTGEKEIAGATIAVYESDNEGKYDTTQAPVASWISDGKGPHDFGPELEAGKTYTLVETQAPDGYTLTGNITFTVESNGVVTAEEKYKDKDGTILMKDDVTRIKVSKVNEDGTPVSGAKLVIKNVNEEVVYTFISKETAEEITGLPAGRTYILSEIEAPDGYKVAADVKFEVNDDPNEEIIVTMTDEREDEAAKGKITVTKTLSLGDEDLPLGANDTEFYVALFGEEERTQRVSDVKPLTFKNQSTTKAVFENLEAGTYYVGETDEYGNLIDADAEDAIFIPQYVDGYVAEITSSVFEVSKSINNRFPTLPEGYYYEGNLNITKKVLKGTDAWATDNVYYAGIFTDEECTRSVMEPVALAMNGSSEATVKVSVPLGKDPKTVVTYYVAETDENGVVLQNGSSIPFTISIDESKAELSGENNSKDVTITNIYNREGYYDEDDSDGDQTETSKMKSSSFTKTTKSHKTGDTTNIFWYSLLLVVSLLGVLIVFARKGKNNR